MDVPRRDGRNGRPLPKSLAEQTLARDRCRHHPSIKSLRQRKPNTRAKIHFVTKLPHHIKERVERRRHNQEASPPIHPLTTMGPSQRSWIIEPRQRVEVAHVLEGLEPRPRSPLSHDR